MVDVDNQRAYCDKFRRHLASLPIEEAVKIHVGRPKAFYVTGALERAALEAWGFRDDDYLVDVGCGGGRLAAALQDKPSLSYLGTDVVPEIIEYCRKTYRTDWRFETANGFAIPERNDSVDMVVAFSVFTHLLHEQSYAYLRDFYRVLKPGGRAMFSFLEYRLPCHHRTFFNAEKSQQQRSELITFLDRDGIQFFAASIGFRLVNFVDGGQPCLTFDPPVELPDGEKLSGRRAHGQSLCILEKPMARSGAPGAKSRWGSS